MRVYVYIVIPPLLFGEISRPGAQIFKYKSSQTHIILYSQSHITLLTYEYTTLL